MMVFTVIGITTVVVLALVGFAHIMDKLLLD
jgi:hypothetical protein